MTPAAIVDELTYRCYARARDEGSPAALQNIFENGAALERRYQDSINAYVNAGVKRDQRERHEGRDEHDMNTRCEPLRSHR